MVSETVDTGVSRETAITAIDVERSQSTVREQVTQLLILAVWFGLLTGFAEVSLLTVRKFFLHQFRGFFVESPLMWFGWPL